MIPFAGSGNDTPGAILRNPSGNLLMAGTTGSFDLPVKNAWQKTNRGTRIARSTDSGKTWSPAANVYAADFAYLDANLLAVHPKDPLTLYVGSRTALYKSTDGGQSFTTLPLQVSTITDIAVHPADGNVLYALTGGDTRLWKSVDGGATWRKTGLGLTSVYALRIDPHHPTTLWVWTGSGGACSVDGGDTWQLATQMPNVVMTDAGTHYTFDAVTPGVLYGPDLTRGGFGLARSKDNGATWTSLDVPFQSVNVTADPSHAGWLYAITVNGTTAALLRSRDYGDTWIQSAFPDPVLAEVVVDPSNSDILLAGSVRSTDGGATWQRSTVSRSVHAQFSRGGKGVVYNIAPPTTDGFLVQFAPDGRSIQWATYFGGTGAETNIRAVLAADGGTWVAGTTASANLPVTADALQPALGGSSSIFLARFDPSGALAYCTYFGGTGPTGLASIAVAPSGDLWIYGATASDLFAAKLDPGGTRLAFTRTLLPSDVNAPTAIMVDASGNAVVTGTAMRQDSPDSQYVPYVFLTKLDANGNTVFHSVFGGTQRAKRDGLWPTSGTQTGVALATDADSNIYLAGETLMTDFPITAGAYQTKFGGGCPWPAAMNYTGTVGTLFDYNEDNIFVMKLSPDGKTVRYSTFLGGRCYDRPTSLALTADGSVIVAGESNSDDFPALGAIEPSPVASTYRSTLSVLDPSGARLRYSTYLGAGANPMVTTAADGRLAVAGTFGPDAQTTSQKGGPLGSLLANSNAVLMLVDTATAGAAQQLSDIRNAFSLNGGAVAPGEIVALTVPTLPAEPSIDLGLAGGASITTLLAGVQVFFDDRPALVMSVGAGRVFAIAPTSLSVDSTTRVRVRAAGGESNEIEVATVRSAPGLLSRDASGTGLAVAYNEDGTMNSSSNPAPRGSKLKFFVTGVDISGSTLPTSLGDALLSPLAGFVPGIYAATVTVPRDASVPTVTQVYVSANQALTVFLQ